MQNNNKGLIAYLVTAVHFCFQPLAVAKENHLANAVLSFI